MPRVEIMPRFWPFLVQVVNHSSVTVSGELCNTQFSVFPILATPLQTFQFYRWNIYLTFYLMLRTQTPNLLIENLKTAGANIASRTMAYLSHLASNCFAILIVYQCIGAIECSVTRTAKSPITIDLQLLATFYPTNLIQLCSINSYYLLIFRQKCFQLSNANLN